MAFKKRALVKYRTRNIVRYRTRRPARKRRRSGRRRGALAGILSGVRIDQLAAAAAAGFVLQEAPEAGSAVATIQEQLNKLPVLGNRTITAGLALTVLNKYTLRNRYAALAGQAMLLGGMFQLGRKKFAAADALLGDWGDALDGDEISGMISDADVIDAGD